ncbi:MAG: ABC transporter permease [Bacteroidetes bacterium]|nr:MAG: ABC transporter permease [Bacteroidota bacterium]
MSSKSQRAGTYFNISFSEREIVLTFAEPITLDNSEYYGIDALIKLINDKIEILTCDFSNIKHYDSYLILLINNLKELSKSKRLAINLIGVTPKMAKFIELFGKEQSAEINNIISTGFWENYFSHIGQLTLTGLTDVKLFIEFLGEIISKFFSLFIHPGKMRWKEFPFHLTKSGVNAVPIVFLIVFLIGMISGYQGAMQLRQVGADIYIADLIGISITRELAPLMTAILVAGRSGSAFAAELGTMKVSDEIDALKSMGFDHIHFLILPRIIAVMFAMPFLVMLANFAGILGGMLAALSTLELTMVGYLNEMQTALSFGDVFSGLIKSIVFGFLVSSIGCFRGLQVHGGAESVGKYTTAAVVTGVLTIIVADAIFTLIFQSLGI